MLRWLNRTCIEIGADPRRAIRSLFRLPSHLAARQRFRALQKSLGDNTPWGVDWPCLHDAHAAGGIATGHYFHQDLLVAQRIYAAAPRRHLDAGSRVDGFVAHVASFRTIEVLDIRPVPDAPGNIRFRQVDLTQPLPPDLRNCTSSLSCLHALEHFGLGRYGDKLDPLGHKRGIDRLAEMLESNGTLYLSMPMGPTRIEFNAQRVLSLPDMLSLLALKFHVRRFSYVDDSGNLHDNTPWIGAEAAQCYGCSYGCGIWEATKL